KGAMADPPQKEISKSSVEASLGSKLQVLAKMPPGLQESHLERCAKEAMPDGSEEERDKFKRYWRERVDPKRRCPISGPGWRDSGWKPMKPINKRNSRH